jgi:hypothetical protein
MFRSNFTAMSFCLIIIYTLIIAGDVELNPGPGETPVNFEDHCLSIFHGNIRSLRNKVVINLKNLTYSENSMSPKRK